MGTPGLLTAPGEEPVGHRPQVDAQYPPAGAPVTNMYESPQWPPASCSAHVYTLFGATSVQAGAGVVLGGVVAVVAAGVSVVAGELIGADVAVAAGSSVAAGDGVAAGGVTVATGAAVAAGVGEAPGLLVATGEEPEGQRPQVAAQ